MPFDLTPIEASNALFATLYALAANTPETYCNGDIILASPSRAAMRESILQFQTAMVTSRSCGDLAPCDLDAVFPLKHLFAPGTYAREMTLPAAHWIIGKIHKHAHVNIISQGKVAVITEEGVRVFTAPYTFLSEPYTKRVVLVITETIWTTIHATNETDIARIEAEIIATNFDNLPCADEKELI